MNAGKEITVDDFKKSYISNGAYWNGDSQAIYNLLKVFNNTTNRTDIVTAFQKLAPTYQALGTTVEYEKNTVTLNNLTLQNLIATLASLPRFEGDSDKAKNTDSLKKLLESIPEANRVARIKGIIALGGGLVEATDLD